MKRILIVIFFLTSIIEIQSQTSNSDTLAVDSLKVPSCFHFLSFGLNYSNKTINSGRETGDNQYNIIGHLYYLNTKGLYLGYAGAWYSEFNPSYQMTVITAGVQRPIAKKKSLTFDLLYSRYFFNNKNSGYSYDYSNNINVGFMLKKKWIGAGVSSSFLFGSEFYTDISATLISKLKIVRLGKADAIYFEPGIEVLFGSEKYSYSYIDTYSESSESSEKKYGLINTEIRLPLTIDFKGFHFETGCLVNIPRSLDNSYSIPVNAVFYLSIAYHLFIY